MTARLRESGRCWTGKHPVHAKDMKAFTIEGLFHFPTKKRRHLTMGACERGMERK